MGQLYRRGRIWWCQYYLNGRPIRETTGIASAGGTRLKRRTVLEGARGTAVAGLPVLPRADRVRYEEGAEDLRRHYRTTGSRNIAEVEKRLKHLDKFFAGRRVAGIGGAEATAYMARRQARKMANGTINRELAGLTKMLRLAYENRKLLRLPVIRKLKEAAPRQGFFEREQYLAVRARLPEDLQVAVSLAYAFGWRMQSEVLTRQRRQVDLEAGTLRLEPGTIKNDEGRIVYLPPDLEPAAVAQIGRVEALQRKLGRIIPWLFPHLRGAREPNGGRGRVRVIGEQHHDCHKAWVTACKKAGVPGMLRHDFRRTAVRNMVNRGIPERVAMSVTGT